MIRFFVGGIPLEELTEEQREAVGMKVLATLAECKE